MKGIIHRGIFVNGRNAQLGAGTGFSSKSLWLPSLLAGMFFIFAAFLLIIKPELLAFFVAGIFLVVGVGFLSTAMFLKRF